MTDTPTKKSPQQLALREISSVKHLLVNDQAKQQLASVAARHLNPQRLMRVTANAIRTTPKLQECEPLSFLGALMQCAALGLEPNTTMGHAYIVPFKNSRKGVIEAQLILGYKGFKALAWRSGQIEAMHADVVYTDDEEWSYSYGSDMHLRHRPGPGQGEKTHAYCFVKMKDGGQAFAVLPWAHVMRVRDASQNWKTAVRYGKTAESPWTTHEDTMAAKTAVRYVFQRGDVPMSVEMADAMDVDHDTGARVDYTSYAMNPADGPMIEGESEPADDPPAEEEKAPEPEKKPAPKAEKAEPKAEEKPAAEADPAALPADLQKVADLVIGDVDDGAAPDSALDYHDEASGGAVTRIRTEHPEAWAALIERIGAGGE